ncbi:MAG: dihydrolipoyl dehydrogenase [Alloprevotella sp.]|nr:dihydrolipoyl dehydrogenase [Alloprevotella sp.]
MNTEKFDIIIIGAGPGGYETALEAAQKGLAVAIVEKNQLGGTCLNVGCIPTKCFCRNAEVLSDVQEAARYGIDTGEVHFDLTRVVERKNEVVGKLVGGVETLMKTPGITLFRGEARFRDDAHTVSVRTDDENEHVVEATNVIIATGSVSKFLPIEGAHGERVVTSTEMLDLNEVPRRLCVIGGGVIGLEFASIFNTFGSEVSVIEFCGEVLPFFDRELSKRLRTSLKKRGITLKTGAAVTRIEDGADGQKTIYYDEKGKESSLDADLVLMAVGRGANLESLNLSDVGIATTRRGISVDENMQTNVPGVYAIGDVNGLMQLAHAATAQGKVALAHILGQPSMAAPDLSVCPAAVFTVPEFAMVGKTEENLKTEGVAYEVHKAFYRANGKALAMNADDGIMKLLTDADGHILGAHILGAHAADIIHEVSALMNLGGTLSQLRRMIHAHPTLSEILVAL